MLTFSAEDRRRICFRCLARFQVLQAGVENLLHAPELGLPGRTHVVETGTTHEQRAPNGAHGVQGRFTEEGGSAEARQRKEAGEETRILNLVGTGRKPTVLRPRQTSGYGPYTDL